MKVKTQNNQTRLIYFDCLRIFAVFAIIAVHVSAENWYGLEGRSLTWNVYNFYDSLVRWGVPIFVMISGALFLSKDRPIHSILKKNVLKLTIIFLFWSLVYVLWGVYKGDVTNDSDFFISFFKGPEHFWFLFMIIGMYLVAPLLKKFADDPKSRKYFLILSFIFAFLVPEVIELTRVVAPQIASAMDYINEKFNISLVLGFSGYYILGYYLAKTDIPKKYRRTIYIFGIIGIVSTIVISSLASYYTNKPTSVFYGNMTVNVLFTSIAVFVFAKYHFNLKLKESAAMKLTFFSKCTLGVYIIHLLILFMLDYFLGLSTASFNPIFSVPIISLLVFTISYIITIVFKHVPFVKKWLL